MKLIKRDNVTPLYPSMEAREHKYRRGNQQTSRAKHQSDHFGLLSARQLPEGFAVCCSNGNAQPLWP